ncbi:uncharacterized protein L201_001603 [Kwoniella dendrophila CBS 6074]|uniref:Zn(2)-C6 fungal-type domain-containing protein n=1 Tax=Kwoniella dendrophila CBS 6074 TaxID=1295534 RepID=A0AAX4JMS2_9TREE
MHRNNNTGEDHHSSSSRYPPPPPPQQRPPSSSSSGRPSSSFYLPPPIPSSNSPMSHSFGGSPNFRDSHHVQSPSGGHTDPQSWISGSSSNIDRERDRERERDRDRPSSSTSRSKTSWNTGHKTEPSPRDTTGNRLPSLVDYNSSHNRNSGWDVPSPGSYTMSNARGSSSHYPPSSHSHPHQLQHPLYRDSPSKPPSLITPMSNNQSLPPHHLPWSDERGLSPGSANRRESVISQSGLAYSDSPMEPQEPLLNSTNNNNSNKHPAPSTTKDDDTGNGNSNNDGQPTKKKKRRVALSCAECAKRKQKCNRETPCQHCVARRVPELCVPYSRPATPPGGKNLKNDDTSSAKPSPRDNSNNIKKENDNNNSSSQTNTPTQQPPPNSSTIVSRPPSMLPTISVRVARLEAMVNAMVNRVDGVEGKALRDWRINHAPATSPPPLSAELPAESEDEKKLDNRPETSSTQSRMERSVEWENGPDSEDAVVGGLDRETGSRNPLPQSLHASGPVPLGLDYHGTPAEQLSKLFNDCGLNPEKMTTLMKDLPPRDLAEKITQWFFEKVNYVRYPIDRHLFRLAFEQVYAQKSTAAAVLALPLVFIVFALSTRVAPDEIVGNEEEKRLTSLRYYWNSKTAINIASAVKAENLHLVETRICTGLYLVLMHERRLAEGWAEFRYALTIGQALGLHRDGTKLGLDPYVTEYRRRLWSYLIHADATYSCLLGRPTAIDSNFADTLPPSNIELEALKEDKKALPRPMLEPTFATYLILRRGLGCIVAKVTQHFQRLSGQTSYKDVEALDAELKQFVEDLPPTFKMLTPDKSYDQKMWFLPIHRYYIQTEILHFTIILHRPWLLRKLRSSRYALSRQACFDAAVTDYKLRQMFKVDCPDFFETLLGGSFREFNAAMIAGISIIIDPRASRAPEMKQIIQSFMEQHPHDPNADDFSQKEAAIIYTLHQRAQQIESQRSARKPAPPAGRLSVDNTSFERSSSMAAPPQPTPPHSGDHGSSGPRNAALPAISPQSYVRASPYTSSMGPTPPGMGQSPEDDHPQRLLDHWLQSNTSFGPGTEGLNLGIGIYPQQPFPNSRSNSLVSSDQIAGQHTNNITYNTNIPTNGISQDINSNGGTQYNGGFDNTGAMGWMDPSLASGGPMMGTISELPPNPDSSNPSNLSQHNMSMLGMGLPMSVSNGVNNGGNSSVMNGNVNGNVQMGGNSSQYWNALIDGIVTGLPTYDPNMASAAM